MLLASNIITFLSQARFTLQYFYTYDFEQRPIRSE